jgi:hypothetical protein
MKIKRLYVAVIAIFASISFSVSASDNIQWYSDAVPCASWGLFELNLLRADSEATIYYANERISPGYDMEFVRHTYGCVLQRIDNKTGKDSILSVVQFGEPDQQRYLKCFKVMDGEPHLFTVHYNRKSNCIDVYAQTIDLDNFCLREDVRLISTIKCEAEMSKVYGFSLRVEAMNGKVLFRYDFMDDKRERYVLEILDGKFNKVWVKEAYTPVAVGVNYESDYVLNAQGNVYAIQSNFPINKKDPTKLENRTPYLVCYAKDQAKPMGKKLKLEGDRLVVGEAISINKDGQVVCTGLYAEPKTRSATGAFTAIFSPDLATVVHQSEVAFDRSFFLKGVPEKKQASLNKALDKKNDFEDDYLYQFDAIHYRKDGGFDVIIEKQEIVYKRDMKFGTTSANFWFSDVIVLRCEADGSFRWYNKIPKEQYLYSNYEMLGRYVKVYGKDDELTFLYNQTDMNPKSIIIRLGKNAKTHLVKLDKDGKETVQEIINDPALSNTLALRFSLVEADGTVKVVRCNQFEATLKDYMKCPTIVFGELKLP